MPEFDDKLKLHGFNNLTKTLSFNIYDISYALTREAQQQYIEYIDETYNAERLTRILSEVADIIGATILNIARQDYDPQGASVTMLISEGGHSSEGSSGEGPGPRPDAVVGQKYYYFPVIQYMNGQGKIVHPANMKQQDFKARP